MGLPRLLAGRSGPPVRGANSAAERLGLKAPERAFKPSLIDWLHTRRARADPTGLLGVVGLYGVSWKDGARRTRKRRAHVMPASAGRSCSTGSSSSASAAAAACFDRLELTGSIGTAFAGACALRSVWCRQRTASGSALVAHSGHEALLSSVGFVGANGLNRRERQVRQVILTPELGRQIPIAFLASWRSILSGDRSRGGSLVRCGSANALAAGTIPPMEDWIETVRSRPGMFFGDVHGGWGLETVVLELVSNVLDRHLVGEAHRMDVELGEGGVVVVDDDGPGIDVARTEDGVSFLEWVFTTWSSEPTRDGHRPHVHLGGTGIGLAPVCAASEAIVVDVYREDGHYCVRFARGRTVEPLTRLGVAERRGTRVEVHLDPEVFPWLEWPTATLEEQLRDLPALCPGLRTSLRVYSRFGPHADLARLAERLRSGARLHAAPIVGSFEDASGRADVALLWQRLQLAPSFVSFCNFRRTREGGSHERGTLPGVLEALRPFDTRGRLARADASASRLLAEGLCAAVSVTFLDPEFDGPTRDRLRTPEAARLTERAVAGALGAALEIDEDLRAELLGRIARARAGKPKRA
jgi:DNA gyrase subunit B